MYDFVQTNTIVIELIHSHPHAAWPGPSGFDPRDEEYKKGDDQHAAWMKKLFSDTNLKIYDVKTRTYVNYNQNGIIKK